jgi:hypothetical protein
MGALFPCTDIVYNKSPFFSTKKRRNMVCSWYNYGYYCILLIFLVFITDMKYAGPGLRTAGGRTCRRPGCVRRGGPWLNGFNRLRQLFIAEML